MAPVLALKPLEIDSRVPASADEITLGREPETDQPVSVPRSLLQEGHVHIRGRTRSGKTSLVIGPLATRLMEPYRPRGAGSSGDGEPQERDAVLVFDLGGDLALFNRVQAHAEKLGRKFRYLSLDPRRSYYFDPFQCVPDQPDRIVRICNLLIEAFNLDHGLVYGGSYYTQKNLAALLEVAQRLIEGNRKGRRLDLRDVAEFLNRNVDRDAAQVKMTFQFLLRYQQLMPTPDDEHTIDMRRALAEREVVYFFCPTMAEATTARQIAGLGLYTAINAAMEAGMSGDNTSERPHCWIFVDEFQELAGRSFAALLAQASKFGISLMMSNQSTEQLQNRDSQLADIVRDNTLMKIYFTITGKRDIEELQTFSAEKTDWLKTEAEGGAVSQYSPLGSDRMSRRQVKVPTLGKNDILETSGRAGRFFLILDDGSGHREPQALQKSHTDSDGLSYEEFLKYRRTPMAEVHHPLTANNQSAPQPSARVPAWEDKRGWKPEGERKARLEKLTSLLEAKASAEKMSSNQEED